MTRLCHGTIGDCRPPLAETPSGDPFFCKSCIYAKATRKSVAKEREGNRAENFGAEVHSDLWGPAPVATKGRKRYYVTFIDDKTRLTNLYFLAKKSDSFKSYKDYEAWCDTQLGAKIRECHGLPWGFPGQPTPVPVKTCTRIHGCGF